MPVLQEIREGRVPVKVYAAEIEPAARRQLVNVSKLPIVHHHVAAMPDVHLGIGATVGSVIPTRGAIIPAAVGVDIGCGMIAIRLSLNAEALDVRALKKAYDQIVRDVPVGFAQHPEGRARSETAKRFARGLRRILDKHPGVRKRIGRHSDWVRQLGTLGGGNHFIEVCTDDCDLAYFPEGAEHFDDYVEAVGWAQDYARANRAEMMKLVIGALGRHLPPFEATAGAVNCHHNYVERERHYGAEVWVTRKGAIRAREGELGIIPGSMGTRSYIVRGRGSAEAFHSCAHGAGRRMSRNQAAQRFSVADLERQTAGAVCRKDKGVLDEIPGAYKDIDEVMANQSDLVEVMHTLKQLICVKG